jgi:hypothetical protein
MKNILVIGILFYSLIAIGQNKIIVKIDSSTTNELIQNFQKVGNTVSILDAGGWRNINIANNAPTVGQVLKWDGTNWMADTDLTGGGGGGGGSQTLSTNGSAGHISISGGNSVTLNVNDADASPTNEIQALSKAGNVISLNLGGGSVFIANNTPSNGQVLKWNGTQWEASTDLTGSGGGGQLYSSGTGINVNNTTFTISNTGDLSDVNEIQSISKSANTVSLSLGGGSFNIASNTPSTGQVLKWNGSNWVADTDNTGSGGGGTTDRIGVSQSVASGGRLMLYDLSGFATGTGTDIIINGANSASASTSTNGGNITFTIDHRNVLSKIGNTVFGSNGGGSFNIASNAPSAGQVLKWDGTNWIADTDLTGGGGGGQQYASGDGIVVNNTNFTISALDISATNEVDNLRVSSSVTGGGRLQNATNGFNQATEIGLIISGATSSVSTGANGSITWTLPDASPNNELQSISSNGNTYTLSQSGGSVSIAKSGAAITGSVLEWNGSDWIYGTDDVATYTSGSGINISGNTIANTGDLSNTNELITAFSKPSGNIIRITEAGVNRDINIAETTPTTGQVMKWNGTQWTAQDDATSSGGGGGQTYSGGTGISVNNTTFTITNTGDISNTNEIQTLGRSGNNISISSSNAVALAQSGSATTGSVLKWDGTNWVYGVDNTGTVVEPSQQIVYGTGTSVTSESGFNYNPSTNRMSIGNSNALAPLHVGNGSSNPSTKAKILVSENVTVSGFAEHGFADGSNIANGESYNSYDARGVIASTINGVNGHYVSFQSVPVQNSGVTLKQYYGLYDALSNSGTVTDYHVVSAVVPSGIQNYSGFYVSGNNNVSNSAIGFNINGLTSPTARGLYIGGLSGSTIARGIDITGLTGGSVRPIRTQVSSTFHPNEFNTSTSGNADMLMLSRGSVNSNEWMGIILGEAGGGATKYYSNRIASSYDAALRGDMIFFANSTGSSGLGALVENARIKYDGTLNVSSGYQINNTAASGNVLRGNGSSFVSAKLNASDLSQQGATTGQVLTWNGSIWTPTTVSGTDNQTLSTSGAAGNVSISNGNTITINVNDADFNPSNEIQTPTINGNTLSLNLGGGSTTIAKSGAATVGKVLKWDGTEWTFGDDLNTGGTPLSGTTNYMAKFTSSSTIGNSNLQDNGSKMTYHVGGNVGSNVVLESDRNGWGGFAMYNSRYSNAGYGWEIGDIFASSKTILADVFNQKVGIAIQPAYRLDVGSLNDVDGIAMRRGSVEALMQVNSEGDFIIRNTTGHMSIGLNSGNISSVNPSASLHLFGSAGTSDANLVKLEKTGGFGSTAIRQYYNSGSNYGLLIGDGYSATTNYLGINHVNGELTVNNLSGSGTRIATASSTGVLGVTGVGGGLSISGGFLQSIGITNFGKSGNTVFVSDNAGTKSLNISTNTPSTGMVLKWDGSQWIASTDLTGTTGAGCNCPFDGDTNPSNELQNLSYGTELDGAIPIFISNGNGVSIAEGGGINLNRTSSTTLIVEAVSWSSIGSSFSSVSQGSTINWTTSGQSVGSITWSGNNVTLPTGRRYTIDIVIQITNLSAGNEVGTIDLYKSGSFYDQYSVHTYTKSGTLETNFVKCQFITDNGGTYTIRNGFSQSITGTVKSVIIKQL